MGDDRVAPAAMAMAMAMAMMIATTAMAMAATGSDGDGNGKGRSKSKGKGKGSEPKQHAICQGYVDDPDTVILNPLINKQSFSHNMESGRPWPRAVPS